MGEMDHDAEIRKFGKVLLFALLAFAALFVLSGAFLTLVFH